MCSAPYVRIPYVSLFVRLWVEITQTSDSPSGVISSASSWGCELKLDRLKQNAWLICQPLREAVSWNILFCCVTSRELSVSLFVRLWVEIRKGRTGRMLRTVSLFVRLWVEMSTCKQFIKENLVSLFVRLWVEIIISSIHWFRPSSASSWGCELKYDLYTLDGTFVDTSASSWGCELKYTMGFN